MRTIWAIYRRDIRRLFASFPMVVITLGISIIPCFYAWFNIAADMDPYGNTSNIQVAVANEDEPVESQAAGKLDVGSQIIDNLKKNKDIGWRFTTKQAALNGVKAGSYFAAIIIPTDFSARLASLAAFDGTPQQPKLQYYVNEKASAVAPKVTDSASSTLQQQLISTVVTEASHAVASQVKSFATTYDKRQRSLLSRTLAQIAQASDELTTTSDSLKDYSETLSNTRTSLAATTGTLRTLSSQAQKVKKDLASGDTTLAQARQDTQNLALTVNQASSKAASEVSRISANATATSSSVASDIHSAHGTASGVLSRAQSALDEAQGIRDSLPDLASSLRDLASSPNVPANVSDQLIQAAGLIEGVNTIADSTHEATQTLVSGVSSTVDSLDSTANQADTAIHQLADSTSTQVNALAGLNTSLQNTAVPALSHGLDSLSSASSRLTAALDEVSELSSSCLTVISRLDHTLAKLDDALTTTRHELDTTRDQLKNMATDMAALSSSQAVADIASLMHLDAKGIASFMASPAQLVTKTDYPMKNYGSSMTPVFVSVAIWVGSYMLAMAFRFDVDKEGLTDKRGRTLHISARQAYLARQLFFATFATFQSLICSIVSMFLGIGVEHPVAFALTSVLCALVYNSIIYSLSACFAHVGKVLSLIILILQIPGGTGIYPIEMMPKVYQDISPWLPWTYGIKMMRETIGGYYQFTWLNSFSILMLFFAFSLVLGLALKPYLVNVNSLYDRRLLTTEFFATESGDDLPTTGIPRLSSILSTLGSRGVYRAKLVEQVDRFDRIYPYLIRGGFVVALLLPWLPFALIPTNNARLASLGIWLIVSLVDILFLTIVEDIHDNLHRSLSISDMTDQDLHALLNERGE